MKIKIYIKSIINGIVLTVFFIIILLNISAITFFHIENIRLRFIIQKKQVEVLALRIACENDYLIKRIRGNEKLRYKTSSKAQDDAAR
jgi:hypothetical protein